MPFDDDQRRNGGGDPDRDLVRRLLADPDFRAAVVDVVRRRLDAMRRGVDAEADTATLLADVLADPAFADALAWLVDQHLTRRNTGGAT